MSEVTESSTIPALVAGNTAESLAGNDRDNAINLAPGETLTQGQIDAATAKDGITDVIRTDAPSAADLDAVADEQKVADATAGESNTVSAEEFLDEENTFDVSRAEFIELQDAVLRLNARIEKFNIGSPHKI